MSRRSRIGALLDRVLTTRRLVRAPVPLYRAHLGWLLGARVLLLEHTGRVSGRPRTVVLEVVDRPAPGVLRVVSGFGTGAQWYRNLTADPDCRVSTGWTDRRPARAHRVDPATAAETFDRYRQEHPRAWSVLSEVLGAHLPEGAALEEAVPVVDIVLTPGTRPEPAPLGAPARALLGPVSRSEATAVLLGAAALAVVAGTSAPPVGPLRRTALGLLGADIGGGAVAFHLPSTRAAYAERSRGLPRDLAFPALHVHPVAIAALSGAGIRRGLLHHAAIVTTAAALHAVPAGAARYGWAASGIAVALDRLLPGDRLPGWVAPALWTKLVAGEAAVSASAGR